MKEKFYGSMDSRIMSMKSFAKVFNNLTFTDYYYRLMLLSRSLFEWKNLPNGIDEKWIEKYLFTEGSCMFFKDETKGFMVTKCTHEKLNYYDEPVMLRPHGTNLAFMDSLENNKDCILIRNNDECIPTHFTIQLYAYRLADISRTIDVNINLMKMPYIIKGTEKQISTLKNIMAQRSDNEPVIFIDKDLNTEGVFEVLKTEAPIVFDKLEIEKHHIWNELMTFLGINNANMDKRERLVENEVESNNEQVEYSANAMLKARREAVKRINELFDLNIEVNFRNPNKIKFKSLEEVDESIGGALGE